MCLKGIDGKTKYNKRKSIKKLYELYEDEIYESTNTNKALVKKILETEEDFLKDLTEKEKAQYEELNNLKIDDLEETHKEIFTFAFKLGIQLVLEGLRSN